MNLEAIKWARELEASSPIAKLLLMGLAAYADKTGLAWPSVAGLARYGGLDSKTVRLYLKRLERGLLIEDSGERRGDTRQIKVWRLRYAEPGLRLIAGKGGRRRVPLNDSKAGNIGESLAAPKGGPGRVSLEEGKGTRHGKANADGSLPFEAGKVPASALRKSLEVKKEEVREPTPGSKKSGAEIFDAWNCMASANKLPVAVAFTNDRKTKLKARLAEHDAAAIIAAIETIPRSAFLMGDNRNHWRADFDWLITARGLNRLIEGAFFDAEPEAATGKNPDGNRPMYELLDEGRIRG